MVSVIGELLPYAMGVALSPIPIIAVILMLFSKKAKINGPAFVVGWMAGLAIVGGVILVLANAGGLSSGGESSTVISAIKLLLGILLLFMAYKQWQKKPKDGEEPKMPKWMEGIDKFTPGKSMGMAAVLSGLNPKNLMLTAAAAMVIVQAGVNATEQIMALLLFILLASVTVGLPVLYYLLAGKKAEKTLTGWKSWLTQNNATVMFVLLLVLGVLLVGKGLGGLYKR